MPQTPFSITNFSGGINLTLESRASGLDPKSNSYQVIDGSNVEFLKSGTIAKANGYAKFYGSLLNDNAEVNGVHLFITADATEFLLAAIGSKLFSSTDQGVTWTEIFSGLHPTDRVRMATFVNKVIICNGHVILEWDGITPTATTPPWWVDSDIPSIIEVHSNRLFVTGSPTKPYRVWHSGISALIFDPSGTTVPGVGTVTVANTTTTTVTGVATTFTTDVVVGDTLVVGTQERVVASVVDDTTLTVALAFTPAFTTQSYTLKKAPINPGDSFDVNLADGQKVVGIKTYLEFLAIFKEKSIFKLAGSTNSSLVNSPNPFSLVTITTTTGCVSHDSIIAVNNDILFASEFGVLALSVVNALVSPVRSNILSSKIQPLIDQWNKSIMSKSFAIHHRSKQQVWFWIPGTATSNQVDRVLVLDYELSNWSIRDGFTGKCGILYKDKLLVGGYGGYLWQHDVTSTYDGSHFNSFFTLPWLPFDENYMTNKQLQEVYLNYEKLGSNTLTMEVQRNWKPARISKTLTLTATTINPPNFSLTSWDIAKRFTHDVETLRLRGGFGVAKVFGLKFKDTGTTGPYKILGLDFIVDALGPDLPNYDKD